MLTRTAWRSASRYVVVYLAMGAVRDIQKGIRLIFERNLLNIKQNYNYPPVSGSLSLMTWFSCVCVCGTVLIKPRLISYLWYSPWGPCSVREREKGVGVLNASPCYPALTYWIEWGTQLLHITGSTEVTLLITWLSNRPEVKKKRAIPNIIIQFKSLMNLDIWERSIPI